MVCGPDVSPAITEIVLFARRHEPFSFKPSKPKGMEITSSTEAQLWSKYEANIEESCHSPLPMKTGHWQRRVFKTVYFTLDLYSNSQTHYILRRHYLVASTRKQSLGVGSYSFLSFFYRICQPNFKQAAILLNWTQMPWQYRTTGQARILSSTQFPAELVYTTFMYYFENLFSQENIN